MCFLFLCVEYDDVIKSRTATSTHPSSCYNCCRCTSEQDSRPPEARAAEPPASGLCTVPCFCRPKCAHCPYAWNTHTHTHTHTHGHQNKAQLEIGLLSIAYSLTQIAAVISLDSQQLQLISMVTHRSQWQKSKPSKHSWNLYSKHFRNECNDL